MIPTLGLSQCWFARGKTRYLWSTAYHRGEGKYIEPPRIPIGLMTATNRLHHDKTLITCSSFSRSKEAFPDRLKGRHSLLARGSVSFPLNLGRHIIWMSKNTLPNTRVDVDFVRLEI
jgi:hypothetical protein